MASFLSLGPLGPPLDFGGLTMASEVDVSDPPEIGLPHGGAGGTSPHEIAAEEFEETPAVDAGGVVPPRPGLGAWGALGGFILLTIVAMWPAFSDISNTVMGSMQPSDATAGGVWLAWQFSLLSPFAAHTPYFGSPEGSALWLPTFVTSLGWILPMWGLTHITNPVATWNILVALGFVADGMAMYGLVRWVTGRGWIAFLAGVLYAFSPFHIEQSYVHVAYLYSWIFPLLIWAGLALLRRPSLRHATIFGLAIGGAGYIDGYYIVFAPLVAAVIVACGIAGAGLLNVPRRALLRSAALASGVAVALIVPIALVYVGGSQAMRALLVEDQGVRTLVISSARLSRYLVPWNGSPSWARLLSGAMGINPHFDWGDGSTYLGLVVAALAVSLGVSGVRGTVAASTSKDRVPARWLALAIPIAALVVLLCSFAAIGPVPGFPMLVWALKPFLRAWARLYIAVDCLAILAAAIFLASIRAQRRRWLVPALALLTVVDGTAVFPWSSWSYAAHSPPSLTWLQAHQDGQAMVAYEMAPFLGQSAYYLTFQALNHHPLFNGEVLNPAHKELARGLEALNDPQTIPTLRREGVRYVVLGHRYRRVNWARANLRDVRVILVVPWGGRLLRIQPGPKAAAALTIVSGFSDRQYAIRVGHWMIHSWALLGLRVFQRGVPLRVSFDVRSYQWPSRGRMLRVLQDGALRWQGRVGRTSRTVTFVTRSAGLLKLESTPGPAFISSIGSARAIEVTKLNVQPA
jgi:hypothetical protein